MKRYINVKFSGKVETIDEVDSKDFNSDLEFRNRVAQVVASHRMVVRQGEVYSSRRSNAGW